MSKILRRPMFRGGGKVSSYGNGIATGLAEGGMASKRGLVDGPGGYAGVTGAQISEEALAKIMGRRGTFIGDVNRGLTKGQDFLYNKILRPAGNLPYAASDYLFGSDYGLPIEKKNSFEEVIESFGGADKILGSQAPVTGVDLPPGGGRTRFGTGEDYVEPTPAKKEPTLEEIMAGMLGKKDNRSAKEQIAENKELFEEVMGGGKKAMIDDLSNMGLSFAGKALKEGATTKSAFSEFFEEESKRPSRKAKVSDAASNAAIQAYLTGEKSYNDLMKALKVNQAGIDYKMGIEKTAKKALTFEELKMINKEDSASKKNKSSAQAWLNNQSEEIGQKFLNPITGKDNTEELFVEENINEYFLDEDTGEFFKIVIIDGTIGKQRIP